MGGVPNKEEGGEDRCGVHIPSVDIATQGVNQISRLFHNFQFSIDFTDSTVQSSSLIAPGRVAHTPTYTSPQSSY